jgi:hypothetical protein
MMNPNITTTQSSGNKLLLMFVLNYVNIVLWNVADVFTPSFFKGIFLMGPV